MLGESARISTAVPGDSNFIDYTLLLEKHGYVMNSINAGERQV